MEESHLSVEMLARWLAGRLEHEDVLNVVVPHFLARCSVCRERHAEILRLQEEVGHWDEEVAVLEGREAPDLWAALSELPFEEQLSRIEEEEDLHTWALCSFLLKKSAETVFDEPAAAVRLAFLAIRVAEQLGEAYDIHWICDLRARAFAHLGNGLRVLGELQSAEEAFHRAEAWVGRSGTGNGLVEAEVLSLKGSLRHAQRRLDEALGLAERALSLYRESGDAHGSARAVLKKAKILDEMGDLDGAIELLRNPSDIDPLREPRLFAYSRFNLLGCLTLAERHHEAESLLPEVRDLLRDNAQPLDLTRLRWAEGSIDFGLGRAAQAEAAFQEARKDFQDVDMAYDAALVSLDLAALYAQQGRTAELKRLGAEMVPIFESREIHREGLVALVLFQRACEEEQITVELVRQVARRLRSEGQGRGA